MESKEAVLKENILQDGHLEIELGRALAAISRRVRVVHNFTACLCTCYTSLVGAQASSYLDQLNTLLGDAQASREYLGGFHVHLGEDGHSLHVCDENSDGERGACTHPPEGGDRGDVAVVVTVWPDHRS